MLLFSPAEAGVQSAATDTMPTPRRYSVCRTADWTSASAGAGVSKTDASYALKIGNRFRNVASAA